MKKSIIIFGICLMLIFFYYSLQPVNTIIELSNQKPHVTKEVILDTTKNDNLRKITKNVFTYFLTDDNKLHLLLKEKYENIKYAKYNGNKLDLIPVDEGVQLTSKYELIPGSGNLEVTYQYPRITTTVMLNVVYLYDTNSKTIKNTFENHWDWDKSGKCNKCKVTDNGVILGGTCSKKINNINIDYEKTFDKDVSIAMYFTRIKGTTVDMQISFGERLNVKFNNNQMVFKRKDLLSKDKKLERIVASKDYKAFKKNILYKIVFTRNNQTYTISIVDPTTNKSINTLNYEDDGSNMLEHERYKNLKVGVGNNKMKILISKVEIY